MLISLYFKTVQIEKFFRTEISQKLSNHILQLSSFPTRYNMQESSGQEIRSGEPFLYNENFIEFRKQNMKMNGCTKKALLILFLDKFLHIITCWKARELENMIWQFLTYFGAKKLFNLYGFEIEWNKHFIYGRSLPVKNPNLFKIGFFYNF